MMTVDELKLLYWLAKNHFKGVGDIVDAGVFFGASTNAFAMGLDDNRGATITPPVIQSYEMGVWMPGMERYLERDDFGSVPNVKLLQHGDSFTPIIESLLNRHLNLIDFHYGNILKTSKAATITKPIEIAFFDCLKSDALDLAAFRAFALKYIPSHTIVVQQDFFYEGSTANKIRQEFFSDYFEYLGSVASSAVFLLRREIPQTLILSNPVSELPISSRHELLQQAIDRANSEKWRIYADLSLVEFYLSEDDHFSAEVELERIQADVNHSDLSIITRRPQTLIDGFRRRLNDS